MESCDSVDPSTFSIALSYPLIAKNLVVHNSQKPMKNCVKTCETGQVFIPEHNFGAPGGYTVPISQKMACMDSCPSTGAKFVVRNNHISDIPTADRATLSDFYNSVRTYCTPKCSLAGTAFTTISHKDSHLVCSRACPPDLT
jgi:hypothetical protein